MNAHPLTEKDEQRCVLDAGYKQVNDTMLDLNEVWLVRKIMLHQPEAQARENRAQNTLIPSLACASG